MTSVQMDPARIDEAVAHLESENLPQWKELDGFKGMTLCVDRSGGKCVGITFWESEDAMRSSEQAVSSGRAAVAEAGGAASEPEVELFEVAVDTQV